MTKMSRVNYNFVKLFFNKEFSHRKKTLFGEKKRQVPCLPPEWFYHVPYSYLPFESVLLFA